MRHRFSRGFLVLLASGFALWPAGAEDFFGTKTPPSVPATPAAPTAPSSSSGTLREANSGSDVLKLVGSLADDLLAAFSMDDAADGSLVFSRFPVRAKFTGQVRFGTDGGRAAAHFSERGSVLKFDPPFRLGPAYTLAVWAKLPSPGSFGTVFHADGDDSYLHIQNGIFQAWKHDDLDYCGADPSLKGWHHLAVTCDGRRLCLFIDGVFRGTLGIALHNKLRAVGGHQNPGVGDRVCDWLDDMFIFNRDLSAGEIAQLMQVRLTSFAKPREAAPEAGAGIAASAAELVKIHRNNLVFVSGADGSGSGFIASYGGANYLFTNAHVAAGIKGAGFKSLDGTKPAIGVPSVAVGHDVFRFALPPGGKPMEVMQDVDQNASIDDAVAVLGNAEGGGVINALRGRIVGIGPNLVEVDAAFVPGNSGSPIIHLKSGKVIGVATYLVIKNYDAATKEKMKEPVVRRFGYRLDSVKTWQPVTWQSFYAQAAEMTAVETLTEDLAKFIGDLADDSKVTPGMHSNPAIKTRIDQWQADKKKRQSPRDAATVNENFIAFLKVACQSDITAARQHLTYDYFQRGLTENQQDRTAIAEILDKIIREIRSGN